jgi:hypothetical protein
MPPSQERPGRAASRALAHIHARRLARGVARPRCYDDGLSGTGVKWWRASFAHSTHAAVREWSPACALTAGMKDAERDLLTTCVLSAFRFIPHELVRCWRARRTAQDHSSGSFCGGKRVAAQDLLVKGNVRRTLTAFTPKITVARAARLHYALGEGNSILCMFPTRPVTACDG